MTSFNDLKIESKLPAPMTSTLYLSFDDEAVVLDNLEPIGRSKLEVNLIF